MSATDSDEPLADDRPGDVEHLAHARAPVRPLVPDHDDVARRDPAGLDGGEALLLGVEHARRAAVEGAVVARELDRAALGREVAVEHRDAAATALSGSSIGTTTVWPVLLDRLAGDLAERAPSTVFASPWSRPAFISSRATSATPARRVHVVRVPAPPGLHVRDDRRRRRDPLEVVDREVDPEVARDRDQVEHPVRRAAGRGDRRDRVLEGRLRSRRSAASRCRGRPAPRAGRSRRRPLLRRDASPGSRSCRRASARGSRGSSTSCWR